MIRPSPGRDLDRAPLADFVQSFSYIFHCPCLSGNWDRPAKTRYYEEQTQTTLEDWNFKCGDYEFLKIRSVVYSLLEKYLS